MTQTIIRAPRRERFTVLDMRVVDNSHLSWAARGLLAYLLSRPDHWQVIVKDLQRRGDLGRDGVYALLRELRRAGYVHYAQSRGPDGRVQRSSYVVTELPTQPLPAPPTTASPEAARPDSAKPHP